MDRTQAGPARPEPPGAHPPRAAPAPMSVEVSVEAPVGVPTEAAGVEVAGGHAELERLFRAEYPAVVAVARRVLRSDREADDVAQETFIAFSRSRVPTERARGWLLTAAAHTALNTIRARTRRARREAAAALDERLPDVADEVVVRAGRARVRQVLAGLPAKQALVLVLRHSGMSYQEVAAALDLPVGSIGTMVRRAEAAVRKELENDESPR